MRCLQVTQQGQDGTLDCCLLAWLAGSAWQGLYFLRPTLWTFSRVSPAWLRWMLPDSSAAIFFFLVIAWQNIVI